MSYDEDSLRWIADSLEKSGKSQAELARFIGISPDKLNKSLQGKRELKHSEILRAKEFFSTTDSPAVAPSDATAIPAYDVRGSAGHGNIISDENITHYNYFRQEWLRRVTNAAPDKLCVITVDGDSMQPTLSHDDTVLVDLTQRTPRRDGIFVLRYDGCVLVKRIQYDPQRQVVRIMSDNPLYPPIEVTEPEVLKVLGRVIWIGRRA